MAKVDHTDRYRPTLLQPWVIGSRPGCIRFDFESSREGLFEGMFGLGLLFCFLGTYGCEPKHFRHPGAFQRETKGWLLLGSIVGMLSFFVLKGRRLFLQAGLLVLGGWVFYQPISLLLNHGWDAVPQAYFSPTLVSIGFFLLAIGAVQRLAVDDHLVIDPGQDAVFEHAQYLWLSHETRLCPLREVKTVEVKERTQTSKGKTTAYLRVVLGFAHRRSLEGVLEVSVGDPQAPSFNAEAEQILAMAVALAGACGRNVDYPACVPPHLRRQP